MQMSSNKGLRQNKSLINVRMLPTTSVKKQEKRYAVEDVTGIMKWPQ